MALTGMRKAAMLLLSLDPETAADLVKSAGQDTIKEIAAEIACLEAEGGSRGSVFAQSVREFLELLGRSQGSTPRGEFVKRMLTGAVGSEHTDRLLAEVNQMVHRRDPFLAIRSAPPALMAKALEGESARTAAVVLSELPPGASAKVLELLEEPVRVDAVRGMTAGAASPEARARVADVVRARLEALRRRGETGVDEHRAKIRKTAVLLRGLDASVRDALLEGVAEKDPDTRDGIEQLMVIWEDVAVLADRPLQDVLRNIDSRKLALALVDADEVTVAKIRSNMSERATAMLDEETSLLSAPKPNEIAEVREAILEALRELNSKGELTFEEQPPT
ncbi:MAG TPA: FliG C-terminal domain-containing protein [Phycisphaerae bacterium]|nr:FliG C-terminal domain-containing protein [Phycisphaerae bacterium]